MSKVKSTTSPKDLSIEEAYAKMQKILHEMESGSLSIDQIIAKLEESKALMLYCKEKLKNAELLVQKIQEE
ncbi:MAG: exodeoxyribonuclease VII small subunit [Saprospiraceae bacterium]|nr:exodeoxyribonuclease VII small subunit [Saprospiraceae bacterium]